MNGGFCVWLTGLSGAGKSTIAEALVAELGRRGRDPEVLDGDVVRTHLSKGLGFSREDRDLNVERIGFVASLLVKHGAAVVVAAISPYAEARARARALVEPHGAFVEVFVRCSLDELSRRDVKGLYARALRGEIANFTGVSDPYEEPTHPDVVVDSGTQRLEESLAEVLRALETRGLVSVAEAVR